MNNERRKEWLVEDTAVGLETDSEGIEDGSIVPEDSKRLLAHVHSARNEPALKNASDEFMKGVETV